MQIVETGAAARKRAYSVKEAAGICGSVSVPFEP